MSIKELVSLQNHYFSTPGHINYIHIEILYKKIYVCICFHYESSS